MKRIVIALTVPADTDIFDVHERIEAELSDPESAGLDVYESPAAFVSYHQEAEAVIAANSKGAST